MNDYTGNSLPYKLAFTWESQIYPPAVSISHNPWLFQNFLSLYNSKQLLTLLGIGQLTQSNDITVYFTFSAHKQAIYTSQKLNENELSQSGFYKSQPSQPFEVFRLKLTNNKQSLKTKRGWHVLLVPLLYFQVDLVVTP